MFECVTIWMFVRCFQTDLISRISQRMSELSVCVCVLFFHNDYQSQWAALM